jgi:hypothetical protein
MLQNVQQSIEFIGAKLHIRMLLCPHVVHMHVDNIIMKRDQVQVAAYIHMYIHMYIRGTPQFKLTHCFALIFVTNEEDVFMNVSMFVKSLFCNFSNVHRHQRPELDVVLLKMYASRYEYINMYVLAYMFIYWPTCKFVSAYMYMCIGIHTHVYWLTCTYVLPTCKYMCIGLHVHILAYMYLHMYWPTCLYIDLHVHLYWFSRTCLANITWVLPTTCTHVLAYMYMCIALHVLVYWPILRSTLDYCTWYVVEKVFEERSVSKLSIQWRRRTRVARFFLLQDTTSRKKCTK